MPLSRSLALLVLLAGCGTRGELYVHPVKTLPAVATLDAVVSVAPALSQAVLVRPDGSAPKALRLSPGARRAQGSPSGELVAVLGGTLKAPVLDLVRPKGETVETVGLHGLFDAVDFAPDGQLAVLTYAAGGQAAGVAARNPNEIELVFFSPPSAVRMRLDTDSLAPRAVVFATPTASARRVAVVFDKGVALFDALRPERSPRRVSVRPQGSVSDHTMQEALFSPDGRYLFLRVGDLDDVVVVEVGEAGGEMTASINFVAGGTGLSDIEVPTGAEQAAMVLGVYTGSREAILLDARGIEDRARRLPLAHALTQVRALSEGKVLVFDGRLRSVVAWDPATGFSGTAVLDADFDVALVSGPLLQAVFRHPSLGATAGGGSSLSVVRVEEEATRLRARIHSIQLAGAADVLALDRGGERLFFAGKADSTLVRLDLRTLALGQVALDAPPAGILHLAGPDAVAVLHPDNPHGDLTLVPAGRLERSAAVRVVDFALAGDLDRAEED